MHPAEFHSRSEAYWPLFAILGRINGITMHMRTHDPPLPSSHTFTSRSDAVTLTHKNFAYRMFVWGTQRRFLPDRGQDLTMAWQVSCGCLAESPLPCPVESSLGRSMQWYI